jgi:hypothetical protein
MVALNRAASPPRRETHYAAVSHGRPLRAGTRTRGGCSLSLGTRAVTARALMEVSATK